MLILIIVVLCVVIFMQLMNRIDLEANYLGENSKLKQVNKELRKRIYELENDVNVLKYKLEYQE